MARFFILDYDTGLTVESKVTVLQVRIVQAWLIVLTGGVVYAVLT